LTCGVIRPFNFSCLVIERASQPPFARSLMHLTTSTLRCLGHLLRIAVNFLFRNFRPDMGRALLVSINVGFHREGNQNHHLPA
jgi:hypothetical protein